jgi:hypothetical protein
MDLITTHYSSHDSRSYHMVHRTSVTQRDQPSNGDDDNDERNGDKSAQPPPPPTQCNPQAGRHKQDG